MLYLLALVAAVLLLSAVTLAADPGASAYIPIRGNAWRLALGDADGDGRNELVYGSYEGAVRCLDPSEGRLLWEADIGGFPFAVAAADVDGDGRAEVFAAGADGLLYAFSAAGQRLWTLDTTYPLYNVVAARLVAGQPPLIVCGGIDHMVRVVDAAGQTVATFPLQRVTQRIAATDLDGDGVDELLVLDERTVLEALALRGGKLVSLWRRDLTVPERMRNWENPAARFYAFSLDAGDLDGDGRPEIVMGDAFHNRQIVMAAAADGTPRWLSDPPPFHVDAQRRYEFYSSAFVRVAPPAADGTRDVFVVIGGLVRQYRADGTLVAEAEAPLGFADLLIDGRTLYLASSPNGDDTIYRIDLSGDWPATVRGLQVRGRIAEVTANLRDLRRQALAYAGTAPAGRTYDLMFGGGPAVLQRLLPYPNLRWTAGRGAIEKTPPLNSDGQPWNPSRWKIDSIRQTMTVEEIVAAARDCEDKKIPTYFNIGHSCMPFVTLDTARQMLAAAPTMLAGFTSAEDEDPELVPRYMAEFIGPLADMCWEHGGTNGPKVVVKNKGVWWMSMPARPEVLAALTAGHRSQVIVASTEDSNSRTPEINLMARVGLQHAGALTHFRASIHQDQFSYCRFHQWEYPKTGSPHLRLLVAHAVLGAESFRGSGAFLFGKGADAAFTDYGRETLETFASLLGKGLVLVPRPEELAQVARVGVAVHASPAKWLFDGHNGHRPWGWQADAELDAAIIPHNGSTWGNAPTPTSALQHVVFSKTRQFGYHVPPTPYGALLLVPAAADLTQVTGVSEWWHTDGIYLWRDGGERLSGQAAAEALRASVEAAAAELPFRPAGDDVFFQAVRTPDGGYRVYAIDPGWLDPAPRMVTVHIQAHGAFTVRDLLRQEDVPMSDRAFTLDVPAGALRIVQVSPTK